MPSLFSVGAYIMRVVENGTGAIQQLDDFGPAHTDVFDVMSDYFDSRSSQHSHDPARQSLMTVTQTALSGDRSLHGIISSGYYGLASDLYDIDEKEISHHRSTREAELRDFVFRVWLPTARNKGIAILQRIRQSGIKTTLQRDLRDYFSTYFSAFRIVLEPLLPEQIVDEYINNGKIKKVSFTKYGRHEDILDDYTAEDDVEEQGRLELTVHARRDSEVFFAGLLREVFRNRIHDLQHPIDVSSLISLKYFEPDEVTVKVKLGDRQRTINLNDFRKGLRAYFDIGEDVELGAEGYPTFESIDTFCRELIDDLADKIYPG